jgi:hypothetical protein
MADTCFCRFDDNIFLFEIMRKGIFFEYARFLRYYTGNRRPEALAKKLPMALFHEGIGIVEDSKHVNLHGRHLLL